MAGDQADAGEVSTAGPRLSVVSGYRDLRQTLLIAGNTRLAWARRGREGARPIAKGVTDYNAV